MGKDVDTTGKAKVNVMIKGKRKCMEIKEQ